MQWLTHLLNFFAFSRTSCSVLHKNPATSDSNMPRLSASVGVRPWLT
jgi:hypothetical protein